MGTLGGLEILVILVVALLVLGPDKLPNFMRTVGKALGELRRMSGEFQRTINTEVERTDAAVKNALPPEGETPTAEEAPAEPEEAASAAPARVKRPLPRAPKAAKARTARRVTPAPPEKISPEDVSRAKDGESDKAGDA